jgi:DNA (cytosine-5)-methyltransferase 1
VDVAHLFSGAGGGILADLILWHRPVLAVEAEESCCASLRDRIDEGWVPGLHVYQGDIREYDFLPWRDRVDCIAAGFPCQDISSAGKGAGLHGARSGLVFEVFRAVDAIGPGLVFLENSPLIRTRGRATVISELVARGYSWRDGKIAASAVGAPHKRERWFLLAANADGMRQLEQERREFAEWGRVGNEAEGATNAGGEGLQRPTRWWMPEAWWAREQPACCVEGSAHAMRQRLETALQCGGLSEATAEAIQAAARYTGAYHWTPPHSGVCGVVHGVATEVDHTKKSRIKACGNGQVPLQAAAAWLRLAHGDTI